MLGILILCIKKLNDLIMNDSESILICEKTTLQKVEAVQNKFTGSFPITFALVYDSMEDIRLYPNFQNTPYDRTQNDIDIVFRSGGEQRISGFFPSKLIYSELYFVEKYWPDITLADLEKSIESFFSRNRRYGK